MRFITKFLVLSIAGIYLSLPGYAQSNKGKNDKFVIVLDVQEYWTNNSLHTKEAERMLQSINALISVTPPEKVLYVKTNEAYAVASISFKGITVDTIINQKFDEKLKIVNTLVFEKLHSDAFKTKELSAYLDQHHAKEIIVCGLLADQCVYNTVLGGISKQYDIYLMADAIGGKSKKSKTKALKKLMEQGAKTLDPNLQ